MRLGWALQLLILISFYFLGNGISVYLHIPLPGSVIGMILLFFFLQMGVMKLKWIEKTATFQLQHLTFLFIPLITSLFLSSSLLSLLHLNILLILIISSFTCLLGTAFSVEWYEKLKRSGKK
ncbi:MAG TPA: CidA/LrgA family protein [Candidatus Angelobacter sp.]|nr:CidA/LrgA family protein [Candidatus Angelobacter sp.]